MVVDGSVFIQAEIPTQGHDSQPCIMEIWPRPAWSKSMTNGSAAIGAATIEAKQDG